MPVKGSRILSMLRRFLNIFCLVGLIVLVWMAVVSQFWGGVWSEPTGTGFIRLDSRGVFLNYGYYQRWSVPYSDLAEWSVNDITMRPQFLLRSGYFWFLLPWWLLLAALGLPMALIWRLTRRRKEPVGAFPIEPTVKSK